MSTERNPIKETNTNPAISLVTFRRGGNSQMQLTQGVGSQHTEGFIRVDHDQAVQMIESLKKFILHTQP